ncbi:hypothetical protein G9A89_000107 [Geosiphon pyriformis]|nr:hypothetical protein G9A89_000107 [Geosiphon pyriformis]
MELVGSSAGGSGLVSAGLETRLNAKKNRLDSVYFCNASHKKPKKPVVDNGLIDSSIGLLSLVSVVGAGEKSVISWSSDISSEVSSVSKLSDVKNMKNIVIEETSYVDSDNLVLNNVMDNSTPWRICTCTYVLDQLLKAPLFTNLSDNDNNDILMLPSPKFDGFRQIPIIRLHVSNKQNFDLAKSFVLDIDFSAVLDRCAVICFADEASKLAAFGSVSVLKEVSLHWAGLSLAHCAACKQYGHTSGVCLVGENSGSCGKRVVTNLDCVCLASIYKKKQAPITYPVSFSGRTWVSVVGAPSVCSFHGNGSILGSNKVGKPLPSVVNDLEECLVNIESSLISFAEQIGELAKKLDSLMLAVPQPSPGWEDIVMRVDSGDATGDETAAVMSSTALPEVVKLENMLEGLVALVMSLLVHLNGLALAGESKLKRKACPWLTNKFDGVWVFISGLDSGSLGAGVLIMVNSFLVKHVCKVSEVSVAFQNKLSVSILGLYAGASSVVWFSQAGKINSFIAKAINKSSFVILGGNFNENGFHKCASFKKCFDLGLINSLGESSFVKSLTWCNSHGISKTIDYVFVSSNLVGVIVDYGVDGIENYFNTNHKAVYVFVGLGGLLNYDINNASKIEWSEFRNAMAANAIMFSDKFDAAKQFSDLDAIWDIVYKVMVFLAGGMFKKKWFKGFKCVFNKVSSRFHKLELLVSKLVKTSRSVSGRDFASLLDTWNRIDFVSTLPVNSLFLSGAGFDVIHSGLAKAKKFYCSSKLLESKHAKESSIRQAIRRKMESFEVDKSHTIRSVLECLFRKVVLDHLVNGGELVLKPDLVKFKVDGIMEGWTRKRVVASDISGNWPRQFWPLDHVFNSAFSNVMHSISFDEMFGVILNLPNGKAAGFSGIINELWKHCDKSVLDMLLVFLNFCLGCNFDDSKWEEVLTNTHPIALIKTAHKILSKILSDQISLACSTFDVLCGDNFSVLKSTSTQSLIFTIGSDICKAYDSVGWKHLKKSLVRIKMCDKFIRFFGSIHNGCTNKVITDFGLTDGYYEEVFLPLLWHIFYDSLLCEVKKQESICDYRLIFHFVFKTGQMESQAGLTSFLAAVISSQAATQHILNVASDFFRLNDILINNDKTVAISINCQVAAPCLTISSMPISIAKRSKPHCYLEIFLSFKGLSKPSLVKTHSNVRFFINFFAYLVFSVFFPIISYRTQFSFIPLSVCNKWDALIHKGLKSKSGLPLDFPNDALHHSSFKLASVIAFANSVGVLGHLFSHRSYDLQVFSWHPYYPLLFPVHVRVSPSNNFLAGVVHIFSGCDLSLGGFLTGAFRLWSGTSMSLVLSKTIFFKCVFSLRRYGIAFVEQLCDWNGIVFNWKTFKCWKRLDPHGPVPSWFDLSVHFLGGVASPSDRSTHNGVGSSYNIYQSLGFGVVCNDLLNVGAVRLSVYTDESLSNLGTVDMLAGAVVFFKDIDLGLDVEVSGLAIALAFECVPSFHSVDLFSDSQAAIDAYRSESLLVGPDFRNCCWIEHRQIANVIHRKNLDVNWIKIKGHLGVSSNKCANVLAKDAALSVWHLLYLVSKRFLKAGVGMVSGNSRHFVGSGSWVVPGCLCHPDSHMATGSTNIWTAGFYTYFIKALYYCLLVAVQKHLYDRGYLSVVCLFCGEVEVSDHIFFCSSNTDSHAGLLDTYTVAWELLSTCISDVTVSTILCKGFVFGDWYYKSVSVYKDPKVAVVNVVNFVHEFCLVFYNNIWLVCVKHQAIMEKNKLISCDSSILVTVSGFSTWLLAGIIRLLGIDDVLGISFGYHKRCLFYAGIGDMASIHISA